MDGRGTGAGRGRSGREAARWTSRSPTPRSSSASGVRCAPGWRPTSRRASRGRRSPPRIAWSAIGNCARFGRKLGEKDGCIRARPRQYAGGGLDVDHTIILEEEVDRVGLSLPPYYDSGGRLGAATILVWGTEEQRQAFLPPIYRGEVRTWQLLTEPGAGSDLAGVTTSAIRDGNEYVVNGQKIFVGSDHGADRIWMIACTEARRAPPRERLLVHDRRQPARHHRAAHAAHGHGRRGRHRSASRRTPSSSTRCACPLSR